MRGLIPALGLILLFAAAKPILFDTLDPDCFWHLRVGEQLSREGIHPLKDHLSFSSQAEPWTPYSWLAEVGMYRLWAIGGFRAAVLVTSLLVAGIFFLIAMSCHELQPERSMPIALATAFAAYLSLPYLSFRPVTSVIFLLALAGWLLLRDRRLNECTRAVWLVVPITLLATNLHLFAAMIPIWVAALWIGAIRERRGVKRYALLLIATTLAAMGTPMLRGAIASAFYYGVHDPMVASNVIAEMRPFAAGTSGKISLSLVVLAAYFIVRHRQQLRAGELIWLAIAFVGLLRMSRFAPIFALIACPLFAAAMRSISDAPLQRRSIKFAMSLLLLLGIAHVVTAFPYKTPIELWVNRHGPQTPGYPNEAANYVAANVEGRNGRIINEFTWGGFLEWKLGGRYQTLLDGRTQVFPVEFWKSTYLCDEAKRCEYLQTISADAAVLPASGSIFHDSLISLGWRVAHHDERADVLVPSQETDVATTQ